MSEIDFTCLMAGILIGFLMSFLAWAYSTAALKRELIRALKDLDECEKRRGVIIPPPKPMSDNEREGWKEVGVTFHGKRLVKTPRKTYSFPEQYGPPRPARPGEHLIPLTENTDETFISKADLRDLIEDYAEAVGEVEREVERGLLLVEIPKSYDRGEATLAAIKRRDELREKIDSALEGGVD